ncbi:nuclear pore complex assembly-domain-containing protein [Dipodascopsis tothii]|uniref:nuclear pore complex assembly-domain-containing protein n=1 Tax=Dipodascopsis tothii TaxID=44089 RepID=UPI0034CD1222
MDRGDLDRRFDEVFGELGFPYDGPRVVEATRNRAAFDGELFFDCFAAETLGAKVTELYPPPEAAGVRRLFDAIMAGSSDPLRAACIVYYVLHDFGIVDAKLYAKRVMLPVASQQLVDALYALDRLEFEDALRQLTQPTLGPYLPGKVMDVLLAHAAPVAAPVYVELYAHAVVGTLDHAMVEVLVQALTRARPAAALTLARTRPADDRGALLRIIVRQALAAGGEHAYALAGLPLRGDEETVVAAELAAHDTPAARAVLHTRRMHRAHVDRDGGDAREHLRVLAGTGRHTHLDALARTLRTGD